MTRRGRLVLLLAGATYLAAWAFGARVLYPVATGLLAAVVIGTLWVRLAAGPMTLVRRTARRDHVEGDDVPLELEVRRDARVLPGPLVVVESLGRLGERQVPLSNGVRRLRGGYRVERVPRGRYPFEDTRAVLEDPFGLARIEVPLDAAGALLVLPRLVELDALFSESGAHAFDGRRLLLRRPTGFDFHSVREYEQGESLRRVHWPTTARRGQLMVKELEDAPRDEIAVLLDADARAVVGEPPDSTFDVQVRAAGSILRTHARRGRRAVLAIAGAARETQRVHGGESDLRPALELLAAVEPGTGPGAAQLLGDETTAAARALELAVVTASLTPQLVERLVNRSVARRPVSLVYVDPHSFGPEPTRATREPALLRLANAAVPIAVVRKGDDLAAALGARVAEEAASG